MNKRVAVSTLLFLVCFSIGFVPAEMVEGQNQSSSVSITKVTPSLSGTVGSYVNVQGTIVTLNGNFQILFDQNPVASGTSKGYSVLASFVVPEINGGTYKLTLRDLSTSDNATNQFQVTTSYTIAPLLNQIQERDGVTLNVTVTGGQPNTRYGANIAVMIPSPLNTTFSKIISLGTSNEKGTARSQVRYPDGDFLPAGALTDYAGTYYAYFNQSDNMARTNFSVGFLDSTSYHRGQTATIKAVGYQPSQTANLIVTNTATGALLEEKSLTASNDGTIATSWLVSSNAAIGTYTVQLITTGTPKAIVDSETISVIGYSIQIKTVNLGNEIVPLIRLQVQDTATNVVVNGSSGNDGIATFSLEAGVQSLTAFWSGVNVGQTNITVTGNGAFSVVCMLTNLNFVVHNENGVPMPFVHLDVVFQYQTASGVTQVGSASGETDVLGFYRLNSTLTGTDYNVTASLYNQIFSVNKVNAPVQSLFQVLINCPNEALTINVIGNNQTPIAGARIELVEVSNNLFYTVTTDINGSAASTVTFGTYRVRIYKNNVLINDTTVDVFNNTQKQILCTLYGIQVSVSVVDALGQPIQNVNVTLNGPATERFSALTHSDGKVIFDDVIGGDVQIVAFAQGAPNDFQAVVQTVNQPTSIQIELDKYVALGPFLVQANTLLTIAVILTLLILFVAVEIYRRKKH